MNKQLPTHLSCSSKTTSASLVSIVLFNTLPRRCIVLLEDIDSAGIGREVTIEQKQAAADVLKLPANQYSLVPSVASDPVNSSRSGKANADCFRVLSMGRFVPLKGFTSTVRAFAQFYHQLLPADQQRTQLTLVGSGPAESQLRLLIAECGIGHCTEIINWLPKHEVAACYESASVFLFPSHEGAGMVVAEAMSYGLPVLCWDNEGPGRFVHPDSKLRVVCQVLKVGETQLARRLDALFSSASFYQHESQLAQQRFKTNFNWSVRGEQLRKIYTAVLSAKPSTAHESYDIQATYSGSSAQ
ncbi:MAG: glycosyltransferase family 1 protein [Cytophagaceae bacterium]|nr:MAG: glycosyltransferase family 1 protein [Cytophagaceae bacterium]